MKLHLGPGLDLPLELVTQSVAILAKKRAGKSYAARRLVEQLFGAGQQILIVDPKGDWWGVRSASDGRKPGLAIVIVGGERGDVPLEVGSGEVVAKLVVEERVSVLLDLSLLRKHEVATFMTAFLENLYRMKAKEIYRTPVMLVIDEADAIAPQKPQKGEERMLGAAEDIVRRGGQRGIGCTLITQRSAVLNKNVLTQTQVLITLRTIAPQDLAALDAWIEVHGTRAQRETLMASLPALPTGDAWVWSPGWPSGDGIFKRIHFAAIETFDSGATPKPGEKRIEPKNLADVDLDALRKQMASTIERAKAEDPKLLRVRIATLERELAAAKKLPAAPPAKEKRVEVPMLAPATVKRLEVVAERSERLASTVRELLLKAKWNAPTNHVLIQKSATMGTTDRPTTMAVHPTVSEIRISPALKPLADRAQRESAAGERLGAGERRILIAIAQHGEVSREQLTVLTAYKRSSRDTYLQRLLAAGLIHNRTDRVGMIGITDAGVALLGDDYQPLPTGSALRDYWLAHLPAGERKILEVVVEAWPQNIERDKVTEATGYKRSSRDTYVQRLMSRRLLENIGRGALRANALLFDGDHARV